MDEDRTNPSRPRIHIELEIPFSKIARVATLAAARPDWQHTMEDFVQNRQRIFSTLEVEDYLASAAAPNRLVAPLQFTEAFLDFAATVGAPDL